MGPWGDSVHTSLFQLSHLGVVHILRNLFWGSLGTPKSDYVICARPLSCHELSKVVKSWQKLLSKVGKSCQKLAKTVPFLGYIVLWEDSTVFYGKELIVGD